MSDAATQGIYAPRDFGIEKGFLKDVDLERRGMVGRDSKSCGFVQFVHRHASEMAINQM